MAPVAPPTTETQHSCRPKVHSTVSQGSYATELEHKIAHLEQVVDTLTAEKETMHRQQADKDDDLQTLKNELEMKDAIVSQLEQDFMDLEKKLAIIQKVSQNTHKGSERWD
jgi:chromosome segregation ATPase